MPAAARRRARQRLRGQAQPRLLRAVRQRRLRGAGAAAGRGAGRPAPHPRRQARRHGQHQRGVRARRSSTCSAPTRSPSTRCWAATPWRRSSTDPAGACSSWRAPATPAPPTSSRRRRARTAPRCTSASSPQAQGWDRGGGAIGFVVGATAPHAVAEVRRLAPRAPLLLPGVGAQGGALEETVAAALDADGAGAIVAVSRGIAAAADPAAAAREYRDRIAAVRAAALSGGPGRRRRGRPPRRPRVARPPRATRPRRGDPRPPGGDAGGCATCPASAAAPVDDDALLRVHDAAHLARVAALCAAGGGHFDADTYATAASDVAARVAAGGAVRAVEAVVSGEFDAAFAVLRPPGHHATASRAMGFCLYNNVAVAVAHARAGARRRARRHRRHRRPPRQRQRGDVLERPATCSTRRCTSTPSTRAPARPTTAAVRRRRASPSTCRCPAGTSAATWLEQFDRAVLPGAARVRARAGGGQLRLRRAPRRPARRAAARHADVRGSGGTAGGAAARCRRAPRTAWVLEGGYDLDALTASTQAVLDVLVAA